MNKPLDFTPVQIQSIMQNLHKLPLKEQAETLELLEELAARKQSTSAQDSLLDFAKLVAPVLQIETEPKVFMVGPHHKRLAALMEAVARGEKKRILISVAPRTGKSLLSSYLFPAWYMGKFPNRRVIMASNTADMAAGFGRKVRDLIDTPEYQTVFPGVGLKADSKAAGQWATNKGGEYYAVGVGGALAGRGADCVYFSCKCITDRGNIPISQVQVGDKVWGYDHEKRTNCWTTVRAISTQRKLELVKIGGFICTPDHTVFNGSTYEMASKVHRVAMLQLRGDFPKVKQNVLEVAARVWAGCKNLLRGGERSNGSSPHRSQRTEPSVEQLDTVVRTLPRALSSADLGASAEDFRHVLPGEGHWVVDIQTDTHNFYCEGVLAHNCIIIDDPFSEKAVIGGNTAVFDDAWTWFQSGPLQRLSPSGAILVIHTRWSKIDLIGRLIKQMASDPEAEQWEVIEFPAILNEGTPNEKSLWPERWPLDVLLAKKRAMDNNYLWSAQYMQNPTGEAGALIKPDWWKNWEKKDPPDCEYVIMSLDAAQESHNRADYNACQVWGVFYDDKERANVILLDAWKKRLEYPELKKTMLAYFTEWEPDTCVIEKKSNGAVLFQEFRAAGIPVSEFTPGKGQDKIARVNSVTDMFESGLIWAPLDRRWAREVMEECNDFPNGNNDDQVDAMTLALRRVRTGGFLRLPTDEKDDEPEFRRSRSYY